MKNSYFFLFVFGFLVLNVNAKRSNLIELDESSWNEMLSGEWMVQFYAPWCPACKSLKPNWDEFSKWSDDLAIRVGSIDVTTNAGLSGRFMITALPTIFHVKDGVFRQYAGGRDINTLTSFVEEKKWENIEPISSWKAPDSVQMSIVSYFFKVSMALRAIHNHLVEDYGIPQWGSYVLFALAIILLGVILGLLIVCIIDLVFPAKAAAYSDLVNEPQKPGTSIKGDEDEDDGLIEDSKIDQDKKKTQ